jgi:hypothetical protein
LCEVRLGTCAASPLTPCCRGRSSAVGEEEEGAGGKGGDDDYRFVYLGPRGTATPLHHDVLCSCRLVPPGSEYSTSCHAIYAEEVKGYAWWRIKMGLQRRAMARIAEAGREQPSVPRSHTDQGTFEVMTDPHTSKTPHTTACRGSWSANIAGVKRWWLFPPSESAKLYSRPGPGQGGQPALPADVIHASPDPERFPLAKHAKAIEVSACQWAPEGRGVVVGGVLR